MAFDAQRVSEDAHVLRIFDALFAAELEERNLWREFCLTMPSFRVEIEQKQFILDCLFCKPYRCCGGAFWAIGIQCIIVCGLINEVSINLTFEK